MYLFLFKQGYIGKNIFKLLTRVFSYILASTIRLLGLHIMWSVKCHTFAHLVCSSSPLVENWETGCLNKCKAVFKQFLKVLNRNSFVHMITYNECLNLNYAKTVSKEF